MRIGIYTLGKKDIKKMEEQLPMYVMKKSRRMGCFSLGAVVHDGATDFLVGMCQFMISMVTEDKVIAELSYIYVHDDYRREGIGLALIDKMTSILQKSSVDSSMAILLTDEAERLGYGFSVEEIDEFLREGGYRPSKDASDIWKMVEKDMFAGFPDIPIENQKKYVKRIG